MNEPQLAGAGARLPLAARPPSRPDGHMKKSAERAVLPRLSSGTLGRWGMVLAVALCVAAPGCRRRFGRGGTGEWVVPKNRLRAIEPINLQKLSKVIPTSEPTSQPTTQPGADEPPPPEMELTLADVRRFALQYNLDLGVELLNPEISRTTVTEEEARFESLFTANIDYSKFDQPTASRLNASQSNSLTVDPGVEVPLRTGGTLRFSVPTSRFETNNDFSTLNPAYESDFAVAFSQPLLRGAGFGVNSERIRIAFYGYQQTQARTKLEVIRVLADAERVYWRLFAAREELKVRQQEYDLAVRLLDRARRLVGAGAQAEVEIIRAESGVADQLSQIIVAENNVRDRERDLKRILNIPDVPIGSKTILLTRSKPEPVHYVLDPEQLASAAMEKRMELLDLELQIARESSNVAFARNDLLPLVSLNYTYNINGLGPTLDDSFTLARERDFEDHRLGLRIEFPIGNQAARTRLRRALLSRVQALASREQRSVQIRQEVFAAVDQLEANWQRILAARTRVVLNTRLVNAETRQFDLGLRTATDVLQAQSDLATALSDQVSAITEYEISQVDIAFATGTQLGASRVVWQPQDLPAQEKGK